MARDCGCSSGSCSCKVVGSGAVGVVGVGSQEDPYVISYTGQDIRKVLFFDNTSTVRFEVTGAGTEQDPRRVEALSATRISDLLDVGPATPFPGAALIFNNNQWEAGVPRSIGDWGISIDLDGVPYLSPYGTHTIDFDIDGVPYIVPVASLVN